MTVIVKQLSSKEKQLADRLTPWNSVYVVSFFLMLIGMQMSIYFTSTWQYLIETDPSADVDFFGAVLAMTSLSGAFANPLLGLWNQKSGSTRKPIFVAFGIAAVGNLFYGLSYLFTPFVKWSMLFSRILCGFGIGSLGVLRSFVGTASTRDDRMKAVSISNSGFTIGFILGPAVQISFIPLGRIGFAIGPIIFNMYTSTAFFMALICVFSIFLAYFCLEENYVGIISCQEKTEDPFFVLPKFDRLPVLLMFYMWWLLSGVMCVESMSAPLTTAMFNWTFEEAVLYNGILQTASCVFTLIVNFFLASTNLKHYDNRKLIIFGLLLFVLFFILHLPLPVYSGPLDRPIGFFNDSMAPAISNGGCDFVWCEETPRIPIYLYIFMTAAIIGIGFPLISASSSTLLSQILGPRRQGMIQGIFAFTGSCAQFLVSIFSTRLFERTGYKWIMIYHLCVVSTATIGVFLLWRRLVPLKITPSHGSPTKYKSGTFYRM